MNRTELLAELHREFQTWQSLNAQAERQGRTDAPMPNGWTWRELLAHLAAWQEVTRARLRAAPDGYGLSYPAWASGQNPDDQAADALNARVQSTAQGQSWKATQAAWEAGFQEVLRLGRSFSATELEQARDWLEGYTLLDVLCGTLEHHHADHLPQAQRWLQQQP